MSADLGTYAGTILSAYGVTIVLLGLLVAVSWRRAVRIRAELLRAEAEVQARKRANEAA